ncbi:MAG: hypothetical protein HY864_06805, partial [Chloroflexi bacterium]|nr:hypothetical protein [Chloroflexota bacterium]
VRLGGTGLANGNFTSGESYTLDKVAPTVVSIVRANADPTTASTLNFMVTFSESVIGVDKFDFSLVTTGSISGANINSVSGTGLTRTVNVNSISGAGTIRLDLIDNDTIRDTVNNRLGGTGTGNGNYTTGEFYTKN